MAALLVVAVMMQGLMVVCSFKQIAGLACDLNSTQLMYPGCMLIPARWDRAQSFPAWEHYDKMSLLDMILKEYVLKLTLMQTK